AMAVHAALDIGLPPGIDLLLGEGTSGLAIAAGREQGDTSRGGERGQRRGKPHARMRHLFSLFHHEFLSGFSSCVLPCSTLLGMSYCGRNQWPSSGTSCSMTSWATRIQPQRLPFGAGAFWLLIWT